MAHEMVHAYDHLRFKLNWDSDLRHAACTEVFPYSLLPRGSYEKCVKMLTVFLDPRKFPQRRVSMGSRILPKRTMETHATTPGMRSKESNTLRTCKTVL